MLLEGPREGESAVKFSIRSKIRQMLSDPKQAPVFLASVGMGALAIATVLTIGAILLLD